MFIFLANSVVKKSVKQVNDSAENISLYYDEKCSLL